MKARDTETVDEMTDERGIQRERDEMRQRERGRDGMREREV